jgi:hypothetical protein
MNSGSMRLRAPSSSKSKVQKKRDPLAEPVPGGWYLGVPCTYCDEMVLFAPDMSSGHGNLSFFEADDTLQERCVRGHLTNCRLDQLQRFRWHPRLDS